MTAPSNKTIVFIQSAFTPSEHVKPSDEFLVWYAGHKAAVRISLPDGLEKFAEEKGLIVIKDRNTIALNPNAEFEVTALPSGSPYTNIFSSQITFADGQRVLFRLEPDKIAAKAGKPVLNTARDGAQARVSGAAPEAQNSKA